MSSSFRTRLRSGERLIAPLVTLNSPAAVELLSEVGFDWLFIDAEHSPLDTAQMQALMQAAAPTPCVVRLSASDEMHVKRALDIGAAGIIAPQVNSVEHAQRIVQYAKYAPAGQRGMGIARAHRYGLRVREYLQNANDDTAVIVQAEHRDAVAQIEEIVRVEGVDGVLIGPYDLSASLGRPGNVDHADVRECVLMENVVIGAHSAMLAPATRITFAFVMSLHGLALRSMPRIFLDAAAADTMQRRPL